MAKGEVMTKPTFLNRSPSPLARRLARAGLAGLMGLALLSATACSSSSDSKPDDKPPAAKIDPEKVACPHVSVLADAARLTRFRPGPGRDITDVALHAELVHYNGSCLYDPDSKSMSINLQVGINAERGPAAPANRTAALSYFVAIPAFFPSPAAKRIFPVHLTFPDNADTVGFTDDEVDITIPVDQIKNMEKYEVFLGLQLDHDELDYNRSHRSLR